MTFLFCQYDIPFYYTRRLRVLFLSLRLSLFIISVLKGILVLFVCCKLEMEYNIQYTPFLINFLIKHFYWYQFQRSNSHLASYIDGHFKSFSEHVSATIEVFNRIYIYVSSIRLSVVYFSLLCLARISIEN